MRSYGQYCAVARGLDEVGDRWSLLIVRELLVRECRYTDLRAGLPGIATNMLAERLRQLTEAGVVTSFEAPAPVATVLYRLTPRGRELAPVLRELARWSLPMMAAGQGKDEARGHWLVVAVDALFDGADFAGLAPAPIAIRCEGEELELTIERGELTARIGAAADPALTIEGSMESIIATLLELPDQQQARWRGDEALLEALRERVGANVDDVKT